MLILNLKEIEVVDFGHKGKRKYRSDQKGIISLIIE